MIDSAIVLAVSAPAHQSQLTEQRPSAILPALGKPMVVRVMERLYRAGIRRYVVVVGMNEGSVASYLNKQWMTDANIELELQSRESLATVLKRVAQRLDSPFMIASYNSFTYDRFVDTLIRHHDDHPDDLVVTGAHLTLSPSANNYYAETEDHESNTIVSIRAEKPTDMQKGYVLADYMICGYHFLDYLRQVDEKASAPTYGRNALDLAKVYADSADAQLTLVETSWILRVESDRDLLTLNKRILEDSNDSHILSELPYTVKIIPPVRIDPQVSVGQGAVIGPHVYVERGSSIGYNAKVKNAIVLARSSVPSDVEVDTAIVTSKGIINV